MRRTLIALVVALTAAPAAAQAPAAPPPAIHAFTIGDIRATALRDGGLSLPVRDPVMLWRATTAADLRRLLTAAGLSGDTIDLSIQPLLLRSGRQIVLLDTGNGAPQGAMAASMRLAGVTPAQVTDIVISHPHPDHVGGLVADGAPAFPNARVLIAPGAWGAMQADASQAALVAAIRPRVVPFAEGGEVAPGVRTRALVGHTPGHVGVEIESRGERLLYVADSMHHFVVSLAEPERRINFDGDPATAERTRRALLDEAVRERRRLYAVHFPWPGLGRVEPKGEGFVWAPEAAPAR
jgi:glyoxylase-like metal-dependent hydrolase (beta-lactamase superfamily II)